MKRGQAGLGLDVGGANLKAVHRDGTALSRPFALWRDPARLPAALHELCAALPAADWLAITMTGELCDCYETKRQGVSAILDAVDAVARGRPVSIWSNQGVFLSVAEARSQPLAVAAANWLALATYAGRYVPQGAALLLDIGSTTADFIPLNDGVPIPQGRTDGERLRLGELVYTGVRRTPLCALLQEGVAAELFATTLDVYLLLGDIAEQAHETGTADGRAETVAFAHARLARMLGGDLETCTAVERLQLAAAAAVTQRQLIGRAIAAVCGRLSEPPSAVIISGEGEFLARQVIHDCAALAELPVIAMSRMLGVAHSRAACAHAVAELAEEKQQ